MKRKHRRLSVLLLAALAAGTAAALVLTAFEDNLVYFRSPSEIAAWEASDERMRMGGLVKTGSLLRQGASVAFRVTDLKNEVEVIYEGILPDLFREGQGVVVEGRLLPDGVFRADGVLAKHDETYMPPEVAEALRESGRWQGDGKADDS